MEQPSVGAFSAGFIGVKPGALAAMLSSDAGHQAKTVCPHCGQMTGLSDRMVHLLRRSARIMGGTGSCDPVQRISRRT